MANSQQQAVWQSLRRVAISAAPAESPRNDGRFSCCVATVLLAWDGAVTVSGEPLLGITRDISQRGVGLLLERALKAELVLCGFAADTPTFFAGRVQQRRPLGDDLWLVDVELTDVLSTAQTKALLPWASRWFKPRKKSWLGRGWHLIRQALSRRPWKNSHN